MALTNVLVQQSIVNDGQPKALLVDAKGQPLVSNVENSSNKPANEETARETSLNIQRMVDLLEVIAKGVSGRDSNALEENTDSKMNFGNMLGFYGAMLISKLFGALFSGIAAASRFIFKGVLPFLTKGFLRIIVGFFGFLAGLPAGLAAAIIGGITVAIAGFVRGIKDAFAMYKSGGSFFDIVGSFVEGFFKGALNFVFGIVDWVANLFGLDLPDNLGDIIVNSIKKFFTSIGDYISKLPERLGQMLSGFLNNLGIPEFKVFGVSIGPFYPFRKSEISTPQQDTVGAEKPIPSKNVLPKVNNVEGLNSDRTIGSDGNPSRAPVTPVSPVINKSLTGESVSLPKTPMTKESAKSILDKNEGLQDAMNIRMNSLMMSASTSGKELTDSNINTALSEIGTKQEVQAYRKINEDVITSNQKHINKKVASENNLSKSSELSSTNTLSGVSPTGFNNVISSGTPSDVGNQIMASSADAESAKSAASSNVIINAPSSTVNAPKESNLMTSKTVRNDENTLSKYVGSLYGSNV